MLLILNISALARPITPLSIIDCDDMFNVDPLFKDFVLEQLREIENVYSKSMFGGYGVYSGEFFFGIIASGRLYFKTDEQTKRDYQKQGMKPFQPNKNHILKNYYEVPVDILENSTDLTLWAQKAIAVQVRSGT